MPMEILKWWEDEGKSVVKEIFGDILDSGVIIEIIRTVVHHLESNAAELAKAEMDALRARLARAFVSMQLDKTENLLRRLREAQTIPGKKDGMVRSLCAILKDVGRGTEGDYVDYWHMKLSDLNAMSDEKFEFILSVVENDRDV